MNCADTIAVIYNGSIQKIAKASELTTNEVGEFMMGVKTRRRRHKTMKNLQNYGMR